MHYRADVSEPEYDFWIFVRTRPGPSGPVGRGEEIWTFIQPQWLMINNSIIRLCLSVAIIHCVCGQQDRVNKQTNDFHAHRCHGIVGFSKVVFEKKKMLLHLLFWRWIALQHAQPLENHKLKRVRRQNCVASRSRSRSRRTIIRPLLQLQPHTI